MPAVLAYAYALDIRAVVKGISQGFILLNMDRAEALAQEASKMLSLLDKKDASTEED